jgi:capsular polysaccharide biosynthesis protein
MSAAVTAYIGILRTRWRWMVWGVLIVLAATTILLVVAPQMYRTHAVVFVRTPGDVSRVLDGGDRYAQGRAQTYAALAGSPSVSARVIADLGLDLQPDTLSRRIKATNPPGTALIDISVSAPTAAEAQQTAKVFLTEYAATVRELESIPGSLVPRAELVVVDPPGQPTRVIAWGAPVPILLLGAALIGLVLGATSAVLRSIFNGSAANRQDAQEISEAEVPVCAERGAATENNGRGERLTTLKAFVAAVRRYRLTFLLVSGAVFVLGLTTILLLPGKFVSSTRLMVSVEGSSTAAAYQNGEVATRRVSTYIPLLTSGVVTQRVIDKLGLPLTSSELAAEIDVANVPPKTSLIDIEVTDGSPDRARRIADTLASEFISYAASLETPTGEDSHRVDTTVITAATEGRENPLVSVLLGVLAAIAALLLGAVAVWIRAPRAPVASPADPDGEDDEAKAEDEDEGDGDEDEDQVEVEELDEDDDTPPTETAVPSPPETVEATEPETAEATERVTAD